MAKWTTTRARLAGIKRQNPDADVSTLREQLRYERAEHQMRQLSEPLTSDERKRLAVTLLTEPQKANRGDHE